MPVDLDGTMPAAVTAGRHALASNQQRLIGLRRMVVRIRLAVTCSADPR
ncbi:hypothetical protein [Micromonospora noduli]|nr:hypothetical protein [Micromonospora noduli]RAO15234.1 hypothetical protein LUPAC07_03509 [Micromonospora noduli]